MGTLPLWKQHINRYGQGEGTPNLSIATPPNNRRPPPIISNETARTQQQQQQQQQPPPSRSHRPYSAASDLPPFVRKDSFVLENTGEGIEDGLGTWAERQKVFATAAAAEDETFNGNGPTDSAERPDRDHIDEEEDDYEDYPRIGRAAALLHDASPEVQSAQVAPSLDYLQRASEDPDINAAWRWRFSRKWQQEQMRPMQGGSSVGGADEDDWVSALDYMAAAAGGMHLQFGRATSMEPSGSLEPSLSSCMALLLDSSMPASMTRDGVLLSSHGTPGPMNSMEAATSQATRKIAQTAKKAEELLAHQAEIERQVAERWEHAETQHPWAAQSIPAVNVDSWGAFMFILARVMDSSTGRQKLLIRGRNRFTVKQAGEALEQEVCAEAMKRRLTVPRVDVLGSGRMEWCRDRDRCLLISGTTVHSALDTRLRRKEDVGRVAGALARTGLPAGHSVVVADGKSGNQ